MTIRSDKASKLEALSRAEMDEGLYDRPHEPVEPSPAVSQAQKDQPGKFKFFRCLSCGFSGPITTEEVGNHRAQCAHGATVAVDSVAAPAAQTVPQAQPETCRKCGRNNPVWFAPNDAWNVINQTGILCPICFIEEAEMHGLNPTAWKLSLENVPASPPLKTVPEECRCSCNPYCGCICHKEESERIARAEATIAELREELHRISAPFSYSEGEASHELSKSDFKDGIDELIHCVDNANRYLNRRLLIEQEQAAIARATGKES